MGAVVFRHELFLIVAMNAAMHANFRFSSAGTAAKTVLIAAVVAGLSTFTVDSFFWGRSVWPELEVFRYNVIDGKSVHYGVSLALPNNDRQVSPWHWYLTRGLPQAIPIPFVLSVLGFLARVPGWKMLWPSGVYLIALSVFPHKELRFLFPIFPVLALVAASFMNDQYLPNSHIRIYV